MKKKQKKSLKTFTAHLQNIILASFALGFIVFGLFVFWAASLKLPTIQSFEERKIANSTKIYDRTGEIILFDINRDIKRTMVEYQNISVYAKNAIVAIEDDEFYNHKGIRVKALLRAIVANLQSKQVSQGGSTLTQQVIKNTLLVADKKISRKIKEWVLALKMEKTFSKDEILALYLNEAPYGGIIYGIQEASKSFFNKDAIDLTLAESAYLAAIPNAPSFYSPYGRNKEALDTRKNLVLQRMRDLNFISEEEYATARKEVVSFRPQSETRSRALHFVEFITGQLEKKYGSDVLANGGLKVITTLNYELQEYSETVVREHALKNEAEWNASNMGAIVIDPTNGEILTMVGSRGYSDPLIDGKFNITTAKRQPGSAFKSFIYALAFEKGYTDTTILFDTQTQFNPSCGAFIFTSDNRCYAPSNYDGNYKGPITLRNALAQSRNVPSVKLLYLVGIQEAIHYARSLGISSLQNANQYGLTLVLGGGEVSLLEMTSAYGVFANDGILSKPISILRIEKQDGTIVEEYTPQQSQVVSQHSARMINSVLSDNVARTPLFGSTSFLSFPGRDVAGKTGTTNDNRDAWLIGYTPNVVVGVWSGNNDNSSMKRGSAISGPPWRDIISKAMEKREIQKFTPPEENNDSLPPVLRGIWKGNESVLIDSISKKRATEFTPKETLEEIIIPNPRSILYWIDKRNPRAGRPEDPTKDPQFKNWEASVQNWVQKNPHLIPQIIIPSDFDDIHTEETQPSGEIVLPEPLPTSSNISLQINYSGVYPFKSMSVFINSDFIGSSENTTFIIPQDQIPTEENEYTIRVIIRDTVFNQKELLKKITL